MTDPHSFPLVSIILGTWNGESFLHEQLDSLFLQTYQNVQIIAIDDGSSDRTVEILNEYASRHRNMQVVVNEANLGFVKNFEKGARLSAGDLISFCDQDDWWHPQKIERMVAARDNHPMIFCDSALCDEHLQPMGRNISDLVHQQSFYDCRQLCVFSRMYGHAIVVTRDLFEKATPFIKEMPHDGWLAFHATLYGGAKFLPEPLVKYRQHAANVFGVVGRKRKKQPALPFPNGQTSQPHAVSLPHADSLPRAEKKKAELARIRTRMSAFCAACPDALAPQKRLLLALVDCYRNFSPWNDTKRMFLFFANYKWLLTVKRYPVWRKYLFCLKMFVKIK
ncbi:MAG TPA: glycosyltransferase family 2 protein, partial [Puia sp.]|nr:glycosyltransferase family 2 protein [Puia sp.]